MATFRTVHLGHTQPQHLIHPPLIDLSYVFRLHRHTGRPNILTSGRSFWRYRAICTVVETWHPQSSPPGRRCPRACIEPTCCLFGGLGRCFPSFLGHTGLLCHSLCSCRTASCALGATHCAFSPDICRPHNVVDIGRKSCVTAAFTRRMPLTLHLTRDPKRHHAMGEIARN
ncbi:hypothetical protein BC628DRAFT_852129 [Trametes gibbosa]|nr:hypothetical protein BC628DRAFT_852129 [Trametes gibbosa]